MEKRDNHKTIQRKGKKGKCSNERGITVASNIDLNIGKVYERIINNRAAVIADISDAQAGEKKGDPQRTTF